MHSRRYFRLALPAILLLGSSCLLVSCGDSPTKVQGPEQRKTLSKVTGTVTVDGKPTLGVAVVANPIGGDAENPHMGHGVTDENGNFSFSTYANNDGLPAGEHVLTFTMPQLVFGGGGGNPPDQLGGQYNDIEKNKSDAKLKFLVTAGQDMTIGPFDLKKPAAQP